MACAEFQYPASWLVDQRLFRRAAEQAERRRPLDPPSLRCASMGLHGYHLLFGQASITACHKKGAVGREQGLPQGLAWHTHPRGCTPALYPRRAGT